MPPVLVYRIRDALYVNVTSACSADCIFCSRKDRPVVRDHRLDLDHVPPIDDYLEALEREFRTWTPDEIVFCGFGEPTLRPDVLRAVAAAAKHRGIRVRLNTNGHGSVLQGREITLELQGLVDAVSVSLNAADAETYERIMRPGITNAFEATLEFICEAKSNLPKVDVTAIDGLEGVDIHAVKLLADTLGVGFRSRVLGVVG